MRIRQGTDSYELSLPADMLESVLRDAGRMAADTAALLEPLYRLRDRLRARLREEGQIIAVPSLVEQPTLGAVDGGSVIDQLYAADRLVVCALAAEGMRTIRTGEIPHSVWTRVLAHQADLDRLVSAAMTCLELNLLRAISYQVRIFDGSHQTPVIALNQALSSANPRIRAMTAQLVEETEAVEALRLLCHDTAGAQIVALPKADSSKRVQQIAEGLDEAIQPLRHCRETGHGIGITYLKPHSSDTCIKVEYKASAGAGHGAWLAGVLSADVPGPHMQEPYGQFVADLWAKNISTAAEALAAATLHKMSDQRWEPYLALGYRTRAAGGHQ